MRATVRACIAVAVLSALVACGGGKSDVAASSSSSRSSSSATTTTTTTTTTSTTTTTVVTTEPPTTTAAAAAAEPPPTEPPPTEPPPTEPPTTPPPTTQPPPPASATITASGTSFSPNPLNMAAGSVTVVNGGGTHTFTSDTNAWSSCSVGPGCTVTLGPGSYSYHCNIHFGMSGVINVS